MGYWNRDLSWHGVGHGSGVDEASSSQAMGQVHLPSNGQIFPALCLPTSPPLTWSHLPPPLLSQRLYRGFMLLSQYALSYI